MYEIITIKDDLTIDRLQEQAHALRDVLAGNKDLVVDISGVTRVDYAALQMLLAAKKECLLKGLQFALRKSGKLTKEFSIMGVEL